MQFYKYVYIKIHTSIFYNDIIFNYTHILFFLNLIYTLFIKLITQKKTLKP